MNEFHGTDDDAVSGEDKTLELIHDAFAMTPLPTEVRVFDTERRAAELTQHLEADLPVMSIAQHLIWGVLAHCPSSVTQCRACQTTRALLVKCGIPDSLLEW